MPLTERSLANQSHFHLIFLSEPQGPSFHRLTKELYVDGEGRGVCVCVLDLVKVQQREGGKDG